MDDLRYSLGLDGSKFDGVVSNSLGGVRNLGAALGALGATGAFVALIRRGFEFNKTMGDSEAAIAQVLAQFKGLDAQAAKGEAAKAMRQIVELEPKAAGSLGDLTSGFLATLAASQSAGLSVQQNIDLVGRFANAMANANIPTEQLGQEMRSIVTANIGADSSLARILGITNDMVKSARESGQLYEFLAAKIGKLGIAGDTAAVAFSSLESAIDKASAALAKGVFDQALSGSKSLTEQINNNTAAFEAMGASLAKISEWGLKLFKFVNETMLAFGAAAGAVTDMIQNGTSWAEAMERAERAFKETSIHAKTIESATTNAADKAAEAIPAMPPGLDGGPAANAGGGGRGGNGGGGAGGRRLEDIRAARDQWLAEVAIAEAAARGQDKKAAALERELALRKQILQIMQETGFSEEKAREMAERIQNAQEDQETRAAGGRSKIRSRRDGSTVAKQTRGFGSLDDFFAMQQMREVTAEERAANRAARGGFGSGLPIGQSDGWVPVNSDPLSERRPGGRVMRGLDGKPLGGSRAPLDALRGPLSPPANKPAAAPGDRTTHALLRENNEHLSRIRA